MHDFGADIATPRHAPYSEILEQLPDPRISGVLLVTRHLDSLCRRLEIPPEKSVPRLPLEFLDMLPDRRICYGRDKHAKRSLSLIGKIL